MFTPPPSPLPPLDSRADYFRPATEPANDKEHMLLKEAGKKGTGRRLWWAVLVVPLSLIALTSWTPSKSGLLHRRANDGDQVTTLSQAAGSATTSLVSATASLSGASATTTANQAVPTVPTDPVLPNPFPQSFDSDITQNYESMTCFTFFQNMTNTVAFRSCRPFSVLLATSAAFVEAQTNLTELNAVVWGTCNPPLGYDQCILNLAWFASALPEACTLDLASTPSNALVSSTLTALLAYPAMYDASCQVDPTTNTYCYLNAVHDTNPSDQYFYALPLGVGVPEGSTPSCSGCAKSVMGVYASYAGDGGLEALGTTYETARQMADAACGDGYAPTVANALNGGASHLHPAALWISLFLVWTVIY